MTNVLREFFPHLISCHFASRGGGGGRRFIKQIFREGPLRVINQFNLYQFAVFPRTGRHIMIITGIIMGRICMSKGVA